MTSGSQSGEVDALQVGPDHRVPVLLVHVEEVADGGRPAGVVDQDVERSVAVDCCLEQAVSGLGETDIARHGHHLCAILAKLIGDSFDLVLVQRRQDQPAALPGQPPGDTLADPSAGAGDDGHLSFQTRQLDCSSSI